MKTTIFLVCVVGWTGAVDISDLAPDQILNSLGLSNLRRTVDVGAGLSGLLEGGFEKLGYVPVGEAIGRCQGSATKKVENAIERLRSEGERLFDQISKDLEARCRSYVEFAGSQCQGRIESMVEKLQEDGRAFLAREQKKCGDETNALVDLTRAQEEERYRVLGEDEERRLRRLYEERGRVEMDEIRTKFTRRADKINATLTKELTDRGNSIADMIRTEYELRGDLLMVRTELDVRKRGAEFERDLREEFEKRGEEAEIRIRKELEDKAVQVRNDTTEEFRERARKLREDGEEQCTDMIKQACEDVEEFTESEDFCLDFFFFGDVDYDDDEDDEDADDDDDEVVQSEKLVRRLEEKEKSSETKKLEMMKKMKKTMKKKMKAEEKDKKTEKEIEKDKMDRLLEIMKEIQEAENEDKDVGIILVKMIKMVEAEDEEEGSANPTVSERLMKIIGIIENARDNRLSAAERKKIMVKMNLKMKPGEDEEVDDDDEEDDEVARRRRLRHKLKRRRF